MKDELHDEASQSAVLDTTTPFECDNCGHRPMPQEVIEYKGDCAKCKDTVIAYTVDAAECIIAVRAHYNALKASHDRLLAALKRLRRTFQSDAEQAPQLDVATCWETNSEAVREAQSAIAQADALNEK